ncbi:MAG TPA: Hsp70 family protein, partial [Brevundimonas sp.]|nr:Hsp70 family protein [Brevundimonas sp.]
NGGLSDADIEKMVKEAEANAAADKARKEMVEAVNAADSLIHSTEKAMAEHGDKVGADDKAAIEAALADLKTAKEGTDPEDIRAKTNTLAQTSMKLGEAMYAAQNAAGAEGSTEQPADDGVVDAEFEEVSGDEDEKKSA